MNTPETPTNIQPSLHVPALLVWTPRILALLFAVFISMFAMDVFIESNGFWPTVKALFMHLLPTLVLLLILLLCWRWPIAGLLYIALGLLYLFWANTRFPIATYLLIAGPPILCGLLFLAQFIARLKTKS